MKKKVKNVTIKSQMKSLYSLTSSQKEVLSLVIEGYSNVEIAKILNKTHHTVKAHIAEIIKRTNIKNRTRMAYLVGCLDDKSDFIFKPSKL